MEHHQLWITRILNHFLGGPVTALLSAIGIHAEDPAAPIPNHIAMEFVVFAVAIVFILWAKRRFSVARPGGTQQCLEMILTNPMGVGVRDLLEDMVGHGSERYLPMLGSIGIFVLMCNLISIVPGFESPTANATVPLGCAFAVFLYYNWCGVRKHGPLGYAKHFLGPVWWLAWLMLPIEIISNLARLLSLTVRLWVNMVVSELLYVLFMGMTISVFLFAKGATVFGYGLAWAPLVPIIFIALHIFVGILQAFVFTLLPIIYVSGAVAEEH
ncbi:MAG: F0F1 ATP synthase subunit A [Acidobacteria bacterium]|nr:F0F1 ATP synthase subunit A [Acidobacteriota bacterium]MBI3484268.1 F0F1 ATP synthase subunit A [Acidobacteriota bacterium]